MRNIWVVYDGGTQVSAHVSKFRAKSAARRGQTVTREMGHIIETGDGSRLVTASLPLDDVAPSEKEMHKIRQRALRKLTHAERLALGVDE